jgi:hypothetical protein
MSFSPRHGYFKFTNSFLFRKKWMLQWILTPSEPFCDSQVFGVSTRYPKVCWKIFEILNWRI